MRQFIVSPAWLLGSLLLVACGSSTPDSKSAGDVASVDVPPVAETADPQPEKPPEPEVAKPKEAPSKPPNEAEPGPAASSSVPLGPVTGPAAQSGGTARPVGVASAQTAALQALAATDAAGTTPAGSTLAASFKAGDTMDFPLTLSPGRCYTILAAGASTIQQMEIVLSMTIPGLPPMALAQASGASTVSLGKSPGCFKYPMPIPATATATVKVTAGSGVAGVQVHAK